MSVYIREMSRALAACGHEVSLFVGEPPDGERVNGSGQCRGSLAPYFLPNVRWVSVPCETAAPRGPEELMNMVEAFRRAVLEATAKVPPDGRCTPFDRRASALENSSAPHGARKPPFDLVFSHYWLSGLAGIQTAHALGVPHIIMFHTLALSKAAALGRSSDSACRLCAEKLVASQSHGILAPTLTEKDALVTRYGVAPGRIAVVPCGVDENLFRPGDRGTARRRLGLPQEATVFLFVGRPDPIKGLDRLLKAFSRLPRSIPARLVVVGGETSEEDRLRALREAGTPQGLAGRVIFAGRCDQHRLPEYYAAADALVIASHYESFCLVALEALACGRPVVGPPVGALPELLSRPENGELLRNNTPEELLRGLTLMASRVKDEPPSHPVVRRRTAQGYTWNRLAQQLVKGLSQMLELDATSPETRGTRSYGSDLCPDYCRTSGRP